jgi:hypothetical protein
MFSDSVRSGAVEPKADLGDAAFEKVLVAE